MADSATQPTKGPAPLPAEGLGSREWWNTQITASDDKIATKKPHWRANLDAYLLQNQPKGKGDTVYVPLDFANVEQKKALLYFKNPEVQLTAAPGYQGLAPAVQAFGNVLNEVLGPDGVDAETCMDEMLMDVLCPAGIGVVVLGFEVTVDGTEPIQTGTKPGPLPTGSVLGLQAPEVPVYTDVPNIIHQQYFGERVSPLDLILPDRFIGSNFDKAPFLGYHFQMDKDIAKTVLHLSDDEARTASSAGDLLNSTEQPSGRSGDVIRGSIIFYKGSLYNPAVKHPEEIWRLMIIDGVDRVLKHDRPYQHYAEDQKTLVGVMGYPVCVYTPRYVSDTVFPPSDCAMSRHQIDELSVGRSQMVQQRNRARPMRQINIGLVDPSQKEAIERGEWQDIILTTSSEPIAQEIAHATYPRENFGFNDQIEKDVQRVWKFGDNQLGLGESTRRTATELSIQQNSSQTSLQKERNRLARWYSRFAQKLGGLVQLFEDQRETVEILGPDGAQVLQPWNLQQLPLRFVCTVKPNTMIAPDAAAEFKQDLDLYQMTANDPHVNRPRLVADLFRKANRDPAQFIVEQLPPKAPEPPRISLTISGMDLNPSMPQFPIIQQLLQSGGVTIAPDNVAMGLQLAAHQQGMQTDPAHAGHGLKPGVPKPNTEHGGPAEMEAPLSKHAMAPTGMLPGGGADKAPAVN